MVRGRWGELGVPLVPALVLLLLGLAQLLRDQPLWYDELYTAQVAPLPLAEQAALVRDGAGPTPYLPDVPPSYNAPYYALLHLWLRLPLTTTGEVGLRLPSLLCSVAAVAVLVVLVRRLAGPLAGLLAGLLAATSPLLLEQAVEARSYGPALLATALAGLATVRWLQTGRGLVAFGLAGAAAGLLHWFALPTIAAFAVAALLLRRRDGAPLAAVAALAAVPTLALLALAVSHDTAGSPDPPAVGLRLPLQAVEDWTLGQFPLLLATVVLGAVALRRSEHRILAGSWLVVPLALTTAAELVRPVYYPRYVLPGLLALAVLAALGAAGLPRWRTAVCLALVGVSGLAAAAGVDRGPRERAPEVVALLAAQQRPGEPVVAADARAALGLDVYVTRDAPRLRTDVVLPPADVPLDPAARRVWLVRWSLEGPVDPVDDDAILAAGGWRLTAVTELPAITGVNVVQRWER